MSLRVEAGFQHLKDALAQVLAEVVEFPPGVLVTVLGAKVTANTVHAKIILSVFPESAETEVRQILKEYTGDIKERLAEKLRLRRIPRLHYVFDERTAEAAEIEHLIQTLEERGEISDSSS
ncbi:MAG: ribosome-binding factor A [Candidatus Uhrbacteria bacterium]|nr:ribosome-binding factor A [Candidatus Uhrbacteria bacterium]